MSQDEMQLLKQRLDSAEMRAAAAEEMRQEAEQQLHSVRNSIEARARETEDAQRERNQALGDLESMRAAIHEAERRAAQVVEVQAERDWLQQQLVQQKHSSQSRSYVEDVAFPADAKQQEESMSTRSTGTASSRALGTEGTLTSDAQEVASSPGARPKPFRGEPPPRQPQQSQQRQNRPEHLEAAVHELALQVAACQEDIRASQQQGQRGQASEPGGGPSGAFRASSSPAQPSRSVERLMSGSWSQSVPSPAPSCKLLAKPDPPSAESVGPPELEDGSAACPAEASGGAAADGGAAGEQREEPETATELRRTVWQLQQRIANEQQKTASLEDALHATLVRSATMEADNSELREFVGNLVGRIANLENQLQGQVRSPRSQRGAMTPTAPGTASTPTLNLAASARGAGLQQQHKRRGRQGGPERVRAGSPRTPLAGGASQLYR